MSASQRLCDVYALLISATARYLPGDDERTHELIERAIKICDPEEWKSEEIGRVVVVNPPKVGDHVRLMLSDDAADGWKHWTGVVVVTGVTPDGFDWEGSWGANGFQDLFSIDWKVVPKVDTKEKCNE
jgi:hypothetical protein